METKWYVLIFAWDAVYNLKMQLDVGSEPTLWFADVTNIALDIKLWHDNEMTYYSSWYDMVQMWIVQLHGSIILHGFIS